MNLEITTDMSLVRQILTEPEIWERAAEDNVSQETFYPGYDQMTLWLLCKENNENIGLILVHTDTGVALKIHPYLRESHRGKGRQMMILFYEWFLNETQEKINKINVIIPEYQRKVVNFAKKVGFKKEGFCRESYQKNGQLYGQECFGITRKEIGDYLNE